MKSACGENKSQCHHWRNSLAAIIGVESRNVNVAISGYLGILLF
jgi:hypothetical protein